MPRVLNKRIDQISSEAVYVGRPSKWGNPFKIGKDGNRLEVIEKYRHWLLNDCPVGLLETFLAPLKGKDLVCWCHTWDGQGKNPMYCHADILLELANKLKGSKDKR